MSGQSFKHSGKIGDLIYSLPLVRQLGGGALYLCPNEFLSFSVETCHWLLPLLEEQPCINEVKIWNGEPVVWDLDQFRYDPFTWRTNIVKQHFDAFKVDQKQPNDAWLTIDADKPHGRAVFSRSLRRTQIPGFWQFFHNLFPDAMFVGTRAEHEAMERLIGPIEYEETVDALELAKVIAGAPCFVGNQSGPYAIAEGNKEATGAAPRARRDCSTYAQFDENCQ